MLAPGQNVDRYRLVAPLGSGGQGSVWRVEDPLAPGVPRAAKLLDLAGARAEDAERVRREARALHTLDHPSLVRCHAVFEDLPSHTLGLLLDYVDGESLEVAARRPELDLARRTIVLRHVAAALAYVHGLGIVHRDVKPANVLVTREFWANPDDPRGVKLVDFGIATSARDAEGLTRTGHVVGTSGFLAPEQLDPRLGAPQATPAVDVFALGVLAWVLLGARHPTGPDRGAAPTEYAAVYAGALDGSRAWPPAGLPSGLDAVFAPCLALHPTARPRAADVAQRLGAPAPAAGPTATYTAPRPVGVQASDPGRRGRGWRPGAVSALIVLIAGGVGVAALWPAPPPPPACKWTDFQSSCGARTPGCSSAFPPELPLDLRFDFFAPGALPPGGKACAKTVEGAQQCWSVGQSPLPPLRIHARDLDRIALDMWVEDASGNPIWKRDEPRQPNDRQQTNALWKGATFGKDGKALTFHVDLPGAYVSPRIESKCAKR